MVKIMKVILLQDIKALGKKGELAEVSEGYGRNYLLPKKLAKEANAQAMNEYKNAENSKNYKTKRRLREKSFAFRRRATTADFSAASPPSR